MFETFSDGTENELTDEADLESVSSDDTGAVTVDEGAFETTGQESLQLTSPRWHFGGSIPPVGPQR